MISGFNSDSEDVVTEIIKTAGSVYSTVVWRPLSMHPIPFISALTLY